MMAREASPTTETGHFFTGAVALAVVVRLFILASILNLFSQYSSDGGSIIEKISPGSYLLCMLAVWSVTTTGLTNPNLLPAAMVIGGSFLVVLGGFLNGNTRAIGFVIDAILPAAAAMLVLGALSASGRQRVLSALIWALAAHSTLIFFEYAAGVRLLPYDLAYLGEPFRPMGVLRHPLVAALFYAVAILAIPQMKDRVAIRLFLIVLFLATTLVTQSRVSTIFAIMNTMLAVVVTLRGEYKSSGSYASRLSVMFLLLQSVLVVAMMALIVLNTGVLDRLLAGFGDASSTTRFNVYALLDYLSPEQLVAGVGVQTLYAWALDVLNQPSVESPFIIAIFMFGLPVSLIFFASIFLPVLYLGLRANIYSLAALVSFGVIGVSNNVLTTKEPAFIFIVVMLCLINRPRTAPETGQIVPAQTAIVAAQ